MNAIPARMPAGIREGRFFLHSRAIGEGGPGGITGGFNGVWCFG